MRILVRVAIILAAALVVVGATLALSQAGLLSAARIGGPGRAGFRPGNAQAEGRQRNEAERPMPQDGERRFDRGQFPAGREMGGLNAFAVAPLARNLAIMLGITVVFAVVNSVYRAVKRRRSTTPSTST